MRTSGMAFAGVAALAAGAVATAASAQSASEGAGFWGTGDQSGGSGYDYYTSDATPADWYDRGWRDTGDSSRSRSIEGDGLHENEWSQSTWYGMEPEYYSYDYDYNSGYSDEWGAYDDTVYWGEYDYRDSTETYSPDFSGRRDSARNWWDPGLADMAEYDTNDYLYHRDGGWGDWDPEHGFSDAGREDWFDW